MKALGPILAMLICLEASTALAECRTQPSGARVCEVTTRWAPEDDPLLYVMGIAGGAGVLAGTVSELIRAGYTVEDLKDKKKAKEYDTLGKVEIVGHSVGTLLVIGTIVYFSLRQGTTVTTENRSTSRAIGGGFSLSF